MPGTDLIVNAREHADKAKYLIQQADVIFCLDFNDIERTDKLSEALRQAQGQKILIDHHPDPKEEFDIVFSEIQSSSTAELIYEFIQALEKQHHIDINVAMCLYAGIVTDTGSFSYSCNHPRTYYITAQLIEMGIDGEKIHRLIYDTYSEDRMRLLGHCLSRNLRVFTEYKTAYIFLSADDLKNFNHKDGDTEGIVNYALSISGIVLGAIFIEKNDLVKISFRSEGKINVNTLARNYFNGGGHKNASGGQMKDTLENTLNYFESILENISSDDFRILQADKDNND
jgi:phosphoesterase RecJ-like protein